MRQVTLQVPHGYGGRALRIAEDHGAVNTSLWETAGSGGGRYEMVSAHLPNVRVGPFADALEVLPDVHISLLGAGTMALHPPVDQLAEQTRDVTPRSPLEVYLAGLQSVGSWPGFLAYAALAGVVVWMGLVTNTVFLLVGAMLIAPFASPAMNAALATARGDAHLLARSLGRYAAGLATTAMVAALLTAVFGQQVATEQMIAISRVAPIAFLLPLAAGAAGALSLCQSQRSSLVSGAGAGLLVAASLAPPAGLIGIAAVLGRWDLAVGGAFLLGLQFIGIDLAGAAVFRAYGVSPRGQRFPHGRRSTVWGAVLLLAGGAAGLLGWQLGSAPPMLVHAGLQEEARELAVAALRQQPDLRVVDVQAAFTRPEPGDEHPLLVRVSVWRRPGSTRSAAAVEADLGMRLREQLRGRLTGIVPLVDVTMLEAPPAAPR